jgi:ParB family transcriptional regulator, chromosome partitioning protein
MNTMSRDILINRIDADPDQPRKQFDAEKIAELAQSIQANGLAVPILLRPVHDRYLIVHGERRFRAVQTLGWSSIPAEVREMDAETARWLSLVENVQRADLSPIEEAQAYEAMIQTGITQTALGKRIGKSQSYIAQKLRLLKMAPEVQAALDDGTMSEGIARQLLRLDDGQKQVDLAKQAAAEEWSVNDTRTAVDCVLLIEQPSEGYKLADLIEFEKRTSATGVTPHAEYHLRAERRLGQFLLLSKKIWEEYAMPNLAIGLLEECSLAFIYHSYQLDLDLSAAGYGLPDIIRFAQVPEEIMDPIWHDIMGREQLTLQELYDIVFSFAHRYVVTMSRDIEAVQP